MGATTVQDDRAAVEQWLDALERLYFRHRHVVAPPIAAACLWASSAAAWWLTGRWALDRWPTWLYLFALVMWLGVVAPGIVYKTERVPLVGPDRPGERADEPRVWNTKVVSAFGWGYAAVWGGVQVWFGPTNHTLEALAVFLVPAWVYWSHARTIRRGVEVFRNIERWDGEAVGLSGVNAKTAGAKGAEDGSWWSVPLVSEIKGRWTVGDMRRAIARIATRYRVRPDQVLIDEPTPGSATLIVRADDSKKPSPEWVPPAEGYDITKPYPVGTYDDNGQDIMVSLYRPNHGAVNGLSIGDLGSGKSDYNEKLAALAVTARNAFLIVGDFKPGAQQWRAWAGVARVFVDTPERMDKVVQALGIIADSRGRRPGRKIVPTPGMPMIVVVSDEDALYYNPPMPPGNIKARQELAARIGAWESFLAVGRSFAICKRSALQHALWDNIGGSTIRNHLTGGEAACFRTVKNADARLAFNIPDGTDVRPADIARSRPGTCYIMNAENEEPRKGRQLEFTEKVRDKIIAAHAASQPDLEPEARTALGGLWEEMCSWAPAGKMTQALATDLPWLPADVPARMSPRESRLHIWRACAQFEPKGTGVTPIAKRAGKSPQMTRSRLQELEVLGAVSHQGSRWLVMGDERRLQASEEAADKASDSS